MGCARGNALQKSAGNLSDGFAREAVRFCHAFVMGGNLPGPQAPDKSQDHPMPVADRLSFQIGFGHLGKFRIVASHNAPLRQKSPSAFPLSLNLPAGRRPLGSPGKGFALCTPEPGRPSPALRNHPPDDPPRRLGSA